MKFKPVLTLSMTASQWWLLGLLCLLMLISIWMTRSSEENGVFSNISDAKRQLPDYTLKDFVAASTNQDGQIQYQLQALEMRHYADVATELTEPYLVFYTQGRPVWFLRASMGKVSPQRDVVNLLGETHIWRYTLEGEFQLHVISRDVTVRPHEEYAETADHTVFITHNGALEGNGVRAYMAAHKIELLSQVEGYYERF